MEAISKDCRGFDRLWLDLCVVFFLVGLGLSTLGKARAWAFFTGLIWVWLTAGKGGHGSGGLGFDWHRSRETLWMLEGAAFLGLTIWVIGWVCGPARHVRYFDNLILGKLGYFAGAGLQQVVIQSYCFVRLDKLLGSETRACRWVERIFCLCHLPNPLLMFVAFWGGRLSCSIFRRHRNLYVLALAHGLVGACMAAFWPPWTMRAGIGFVRIIAGL